jgi:hypothetical protein
MIFPTSDMDGSFRFENRELEEGRSHASRGNPNRGFPSTHAGMGRLRKLRGAHTEARRYLTQALEIFKRLGTLIESDKV